MPLVRRLPHLRGFTNIWRVEYAIVNVDRLNVFSPGTEVTPEVLAQTGMIKAADVPVKILGDGKLDCALTVKAHKFSASARAKIEAAGGRAEDLSLS